MNRLTEGIKAFLYDSRKKGARSAAAVIMAAAVVFSVAAGLVRPAVSFTGNVEYTETRGELYGAYPADMPENAGNALEITNTPDSKFTGIYSISASVTNDSLLEGTEIVKYFAELMMSFKLTAETVAEIRASHGDSIKFTLDVKDPDDLTKTADAIQMFEGMKLSDDVVASGSKVTIGKYYIDPVKKEVTIQFDFNSTYLKEKEGSAIDGGFNLQTWVWDENNKTEDKEFSIAGTNVTVPIYRYTHQPDLNVTKTYNNDFFEGTEGDTMQGKASLGSSFDIVISSENGINETVIEINDKLNCSSIHFDLSEGSTVPLYDLAGNKITDEYPKLIIDKIVKDGFSSTLTARLVACSTDEESGEPMTSDLFKEGFAYKFSCPVAVNEEFINADGEVQPTAQMYEIRGSNTIDVKANNVVSDSDDDEIYVNLRAYIDKDNGTYNPEDNTITWTYGIFKNNGWWRNGVINVDDLIGGPDGTIPDIVPGSISMEVATSTGKESEDENRERLLYESPDPATNGVNGVSYNAETGRFTIDMVTKPWDGIPYNEKPVKAFRVTYKTRVTEEDYGTTVTNWVGMRDPDEPEDSENKYNCTDTGTTPVASPDVAKTGTLGESGITWTVTVTNTEEQDLSGMKLSDLLTYSGGTAEQFDLANAKVNGGTITDVFEAEGSQLTFKAGSKAASYVITYEQAMTEDELISARGKSYTNTVTVKTPDDKELKTVTSQVDIPQQYEVRKEGTLSADGRMIYTVTFVNQYGMQLQGETIDDTLTLINSNGTPADASEYKLTLISPESGVTVTPAFSGSTLTTSITVDEETTAQRYTVTYAVEPVSGSFMGRTGMQLNNTAQWRGAPDAHDSSYKTIEKFVSLGNKEGTYNQRSNTVTWTVTVNNPYGVDLGAYPTADAPYKLYDTLFGTGELISFRVLDAAGAVVSSAGDLAAVNGSARETVNETECGSYSFPAGMTSASYRIVYETKCPDQPMINVNNSVIYDGEKKDSNVTVYDGNRTFNRINKYSSAAGDINAEGKVTVSWLTEVISSTGGFLTKAITDTMSAEWQFADSETADDKDMSSVEHYMSAEQFELSRFMISAYSAAENQWGGYDWERLSDVPDYSALFELVRTGGTEDKVTAFELRPKTFPEGSDEYNALAAIERLTVEYNTTGAGADTLRNTLTDNDILRYKNTAQTPSTNPVTGTKEYKKQPAITKTMFGPGKTDNNLYHRPVSQLADEIGLTQFKQSNAQLLEWYGLDDSYYYLYYKLEVNKFQNFSQDDDITVTDTYPAGTELYNAQNLTKIETDGKAFSPIPTEESGNAPSVAVDEGEGTLTFTIPAAVHNGKAVYVEYWLRISKDDFDALMNSGSGKVQLNNRAETGGEFDEIGLTVTDDIELIKKSSASGGDNAVTYTLDINPKRRKLLTDGLESLVVKDTINLADDGEHALCPVEFNQLVYDGGSENDSVKVYRVEENGDLTRLDLGKLGFKAPVKQSLPVQGGNLGYGDVYTFEVEVPDETYIKIVYDYKFSFNNESKKASANYNFSEMSLKNKAVIDGKNASAEKDSNYSFKKDESSAAYARAMPDIRIRKSSKESWAQTLEGAQFELRRYNKETHVWESFVNFDKVTEIWLEKPGDHNSESSLGEASFGIWQAGATPKPLETGADGKVTLPSLQSYYKKTVNVNSGTVERYYYNEDVGGSGEQPYFYVLTEIKAATGYSYAEGENEYYFFEQPDGKSYAQAYPAEAAADALDKGLLADGTVINVVRPNQLIELTNDKMQLDVRKSWSGDAAGTRHEPIEVTLYESAQPPKDTATASAVKLTIMRAWSSDAPLEYEYVINNGSFFELDLWTSGVNKDSVSTTGGISYTKVSADCYSFKSNEPITGDAEFTITCYYEPDTLKIENLNIRGANTDPLFDTSQATVKKTVTLSEENGWYAEFDTSQLDSSKYYYIKEYAPDGYIASYITNGIHYGTLELENVKSEIDVQKYWNDRTDAYRPDSVSVKLYEASEPPGTPGDWHWVTFEVREGDKVLYSCKDAYADGSRFTAVLYAPDTTYIGGNSVGVTASDTGQSGGVTRFAVEGLADVTDDCTYVLYVGNTNGGELFLDVTGSPVSAYSPGVDLESPTTRKVAEAELTSGSNWYHKFTDVVFKSDRYYYIVEETPEGYRANYLVNGVQNGLIELINRADRFGSLKVTKQWLGDDSAGIQSADFTLYGYEESVTQPVSDYQLEQSKAFIRLTLTDEQDPTRSTTKTYLVDRHDTNFIMIAGRMIYGPDGNKYTVNGTEYSKTWSSNNENVDTYGCGIKLRIPENTANENRELNVAVTISESYGITGIEEWRTPKPTSDDYFITCEDSAGNTVTEYDPDSAQTAELRAAQVRLPDSAEAVVEKEFTITAGDGWETTLDQLPLWADNDRSRPIYYYIVEKSSGRYIPLDYSLNGFTLSERELSEAEVLNQKQQVEEYELPESGGEGTDLFFIAGGTAMLLAAAVYIRKRRAAA